MGVQIPPCKGAILTRKGGAILKYRKSLPWTVQNSWTDRDGIWDAEWGGPKEACIRQVQIPYAQEQFWRGKRQTIVKYKDLLPWTVQKQPNRSRCRLGYTYWICASDSVYLLTLCVLQMFVLLLLLLYYTWVGPRKHLLDGVHIGATCRIWPNHSCAAAMRPFHQITLTTCWIIATQS